MIETVAALLAAVAIAFAWTIFRLERAASRRRDISSARASLASFDRIAADLGPDQPGWGQIYFSTDWNPATAVGRANEARQQVQNKGFDQVFVLPTEPLAVLATSPSGGDLVSAETVFLANWGLWRVKVFNQLVTQQDEFNMRHAAEIFDDGTSDQRRVALAEVAHELSMAVHLTGIGRAGMPGGWYDRLRRSVEADVRRLDDMAAHRWWHYQGERHLAVGDLIAVALCIALVALAIVTGVRARSDENSNDMPGREGRDSPARGVPPCATGRV